MNSYSRFRMLILEDPDVAPIVLDLIESLKDTGFEHWIEPIVAKDIQEAREKVAQADMAFIDIGRSEEHKNLALAVLGGLKMPVIITSSLPQHQGIRDNPMVGFISKSAFNLKKITADLSRLGRIASAKNARPKDNRTLVI
jgi:hypothetical protein